MTVKVKMPKYKACPFCGFNVGLRKNINGGYYLTHIGDAPKCYFSYTVAFFSDYETLMELWNTRAKE